MREHIFMTSADCTCDQTGECFVCKYITAGGLGVCKVCNGMEGDLTTECCGRKITAQESEQIYEKGTLDFRHGFWIQKPNPTYQVLGKNWR